MGIFLPHGDRGERLSELKKLPHHIEVYLQQNSAIEPQTK